MLVIGKCFPKMLFNRQVSQCVLDIIFWWTFDFLLNISIRRYHTFKFSLLDFSLHLRKLQLPSCIKEILYVNTHFKGKSDGIKVNWNSFSLSQMLTLKNPCVFLMPSWTWVTVLWSLFINLNLKSYIRMHLKRCER